MPGKTFFVRLDSRSPDFVGSGLHRSKRLAIEGLLLGGFRIWLFICQVIRSFWLNQAWFKRPGFETPGANPGYQVSLALVTSGGFRRPLADNAFKTWAFGFAFRTLGDVGRSPRSESFPPGQLQPDFRSGGFIDSNT
jgi:hypothetical protein